MRWLSVIGDMSLLRHWCDFTSWPYFGKRGRRSWVSLHPRNWGGVVHTAGGLHVTVAVLWTAVDPVLAAHRLHKGLNCSSHRCLTIKAGWMFVTDSRWSHSPGCCSMCGPPRSHLRQGSPPPKPTPAPPNTSASTSASAPARGRMHASDPD